MNDKQSQPFLLLERIGSVPSMELRLRDDGQVEYRYVVEEGHYPSFNGDWRIMSDDERQQAIRSGGRVARWLLSLNYQQQKGSQK